MKPPTETAEVMPNVLDTVIRAPFAHSSMRIESHRNCFFPTVDRIPSDPSIDENPTGVLHKSSIVEEDGSFHSPTILKSETALQLNQQDDPQQYLQEQSSASLSLQPNGDSVKKRGHGVWEDNVSSGKQGSFSLQLRCTLKRLLIIMSREWCTTLCDFILPLIFVLGSILMWVLLGTEKGVVENYFGVGHAQDFMSVMSLLRSSMCYDSQFDPIPGLSACSALTLPASVRFCPQGRRAPAGLCCNMLYLAAAVRVVASFPGNTNVIPEFDDLVALHWCTSDERFSIPVVGDASNALNGGFLYFAPDTPDTAALRAYFQSNTVFFGAVDGGTFPTVADAEAHVRGVTESSTPIWGIVQVNALNAGAFDVSIRLNASSLPDSASIVNPFYYGGLQRWTGDLYLLSGFVTLQTMAYNFYAANYLSLSSVQSQLTYTPMPTEAYHAESLFTYGAETVSLILVLAFLYPVSQRVKRIVLEKELRIREAMLIMGLSEIAMYLAFFIIYLVQNVVLSLLIALAVHLSYLKNIDFFTTFFLFFLFGLSIITLSGALAALFSKARLAALLAPLIYFVLSIPLFAMRNSPASARTGMMILSPSALVVGIGVLAEHHMMGGVSGGGWMYFRDSPKLLVVFIFLLVDSVLYLLLMIYLDMVIPKDWGTSKHPLFFIIDPVKYCFCRRREEDAEDVEDGRAADGVFEESVDGSEASVRTVGLHKEYRRGNSSFCAVNRLHWLLREGEISVLLGHNGAGKSTTVNLMTGMVAPDGGDCFIYGRSVRRELREARQEIGFCPQHNILWPSLTCREHLEYFASIKGLTGAALDAAVQSLLQAVDLKDKEFYFSKSLSGGQKRKLSVAIAFVGGSRLILLDEPTAGMDVAARRHTWDLLKAMAARRTILLTTHFMDEADLLGDTVSIMSHGRLQCHGSSSFLKSRLGVGFVLTMSITPQVDRTLVEELIKRYVPDADLAPEGPTEVSSRLPMESKSVFPDLLASLESEGMTLGIKGYSLSATTLEEIFLRIANGFRGDGEDRKVEGLAQAVWRSPRMEDSCALFRSQLRAMLAKKLWNSLRDRRMQFFQIIFPVLCVLLAMLLTLINFWSSSPLVLNYNLYGTTVEVPVANCASDLGSSPAFGSSEVVVRTWTGVTGGQPFSDDLLASYFTHPFERPSGFQCSGTTISPSPLPYKDIFFNSSMLHDAPIATAAYYNAHLSHLAGRALNMVTVAEAMPKTDQEEAVKDSIYVLMISVIVMVPFTFIPSTFAGWVVKERETKARHLQTVSGLSFYVYWLSNAIFDFASYILTIVLVLIVFLIFHREEYVGKDSVGATIVLFLLYGTSGITMAYCLSFLFKEHSTAQNVVMLANFIVGFLLVLTTSALALNLSTENVAKILGWIFRLIPSYCVGEGINGLATARLMQAFGFNVRALDMDVVGWPCVFMAIETVFFSLLVLFIDHPTRRQRTERLLHNPDAPPEIIEDEDPDVTAECLEISRDPARSSDLAQVRNLRKVYANGKVAVRNLTFGVKPGEVFGFLGTNGAGKTTVISILCQEFYLTSGHACICGHDIVQESGKALQCIGYCPQFDACLDLLTTEEHLYMYAGVRGIVEEARKEVVESLLQLLDLVEYRQTRANQLSGGNRRKLSVAVSFIGGPQVVFLDEPSAGMDPVARRGLWTAIEHVVGNCAVVLTTHHLEEVEALAHRVAIMVDGSLRCIGSKTHLKLKYGTGFEVNVRVASTGNDAVECVERMFASEMPTAKLVESRVGRLTYELPGDTRLSSVFGLLETHKKNLPIEDYMVSATSIEQVFLRISEEAEMREEMEQREKEEAAASKSPWCCF